jgi:hypothetical protein
MVGQSLAGCTPDRGAGVGYNWAADRIEHPPSGI